MNDTDLEAIFLEKIKVIGDGEFTLLGTPDELMTKLKQWALREQVKELETITAIEVDGTYESYGGAVDKYIDDRIAKINKQLGKESKHGNNN